MKASRRAIAMAACTGMVALHLTFPMMVALAETQVRKTDVAEVFCGVGSIWNAGAAFGYHCEGFDKDMDQGMNVFFCKWPWGSGENGGQGKAWWITLDIPRLLIILWALCCTN